MDLEDFVARVCIRLGFSPDEILPDVRARIVTYHVMGWGPYWTEHAIRQYLGMPWP